MNRKSLETHSPAASSADHPDTTPSSPPPLPMPLPAPLSNVDPKPPPPPPEGPIRALCDDAAALGRDDRNPNDSSGWSLDGDSSSGGWRRRQLYGDDCDHDHDHDSCNEGRQLGDPDEATPTTTRQRWWWRLVGDGLNRDEATATT
ncbi:hypothetical protein EDB89DRAFT_2081147 [Lactarius sanguifluus]|nr:hypothetical protein EDB89DRAFT_2081147 [Lactarius sanguifluus]